MTSYPPEPWDLRGTLHASAFLVPLADVPADVPAGCTPVRIGKFGVVGTAWVDYGPGGVMQYRELMATLLVRRGLQVMPTITQIWVDSAASMAGGGELWGIPKELATFDFTAADSTAADSTAADSTAAQLSARDDAGQIARASVRRLVRLPGRWPANFRVAQWLHGRPTFSPVHSKAVLAVARVTFEADPSGPLRFLTGRRPVMSFTMADFQMTFGSRQTPVSSGSMEL